MRQEQGFVLGLLPRLLTHDLPPMRRMVCWLLIYQSREPNPKAFTQPSMPLSDSNNLRRIARMSQFLDGANAILTLWLPAFLGMFIYDIYNYLKTSDNHYQMDVSSLILGGASHNYHYQNSALSSNLGGDIPARLNFWSFAFIIGAALVNGVINLFLRLDKSTLQTPELMVSSERSCIHRFWADMVCALPYYSKIAREISAAQCEIIWEKEDDKKYPSGYELPEVTIGLTMTLIPKASSPKIMAFKTMIQERSFFAKWLLIATLGNIIYHRQDDVGDQALAILEEIDFRSDPLSYLYANYQIWCSGCATSLSTHLFSYLLIYPLQFFARLRFWSLIINKIIQYKHFKSAEQQCQQKNKIWHYISERGNYECTVCDWDFVDYRNSLQGQGCLNLLLGAPRSPSEILNKLMAIESHGPFTTIDFSHQTWTQWPLLDWQNIMEYLGSSAFNYTQVLNLSQIAFESTSVSPDFLQSITNYLQQSQIVHLDLSHLLLNLQGILVLLPGLCLNHRIQSLNFSHTFMGDEAAAQLLQIIPQLLQLETLIFSFVNMTGSNIPLLNIALAQSQTNLLDISGNPLIGSDLEQFARNLKLTALRNIDVSNIDLYDTSMNNFGLGLSESLLRHLSLQDCQLSDQQIKLLFPYISNSSITCVNFAKNQIGYDGLKRISEKILESHVETFILDDNYIDDAALNLFNFVIENVSSPLLHLSISGNWFSTSGFSTFIESVANSFLQVLRVSRTSLGDQGINYFIKSMVNNTHLRELSCSNIGLTSDGMSDLLYHIPNTVIINLDLSKNLADAAVGQPLQTALNGTQLQTLDLSNTHLAVESLEETLATILSYSKLESLDVSYNSIDDNFMISLAKHLIKQVSNSDYWLSNLRDDVDFNRAVVGTTANTSLKYLAAKFAQITDRGARSLCLVLESTAITNNNLQLTGNPLNGTQTGIHGCFVKENLTSSKNGFMSSSGIFNSILLVFGLIFFALHILSRKGEGLLGAFIGGVTVALLNPMNFDLNSQELPWLVFGGAMLGLQVDQALKRIYPSIGFFKKSVQPDLTLKVANQCVLQ